MKIYIKSFESNGSQIYKGFYIIQDPGSDGYNIYNKYRELEEEGVASMRDAKLFVDGLIMNDIYSSTDSSKIDHKIQETIMNIKDIIADYAQSGEFYNSSSGHQRFFSIPISSNADSSDYSRYQKEIAEALPLARVNIIMDNNEILVDVSRYYTDVNSSVEGIQSSCDTINAWMESAEWQELASKQVPDSDGFLTDYTLYTDGVNFICMFGDKDLYEPSYDYADFDTVDEEEAWDWFNNYTGFEDDIYGATSNTSDAKDLKFDEEWDNKFGEPSTEVFTRDEFFNWMNEVISFESSK